MKRFNTFTDVAIMVAGWLDPHNPILPCVIVANPGTERNGTPEVDILVRGEQRRALLIAPSPIKLFDAWAIADPSGQWLVIATNYRLTGHYP